VAIVKHMIPCGLATREDIGAAFEEALAGDPVSAFGGIVALNRPLSGELAARLSETRFDIIIAPEFAPAAVDHLRRRRSLRLLQLPAPSASGIESSEPDLRVIQGGLLVQSPDSSADDADAERVVTDRAPSPAEMRDLRYAWRAVRYVKSNGIVLVKDQAIIGVGSGQPNRLESVAIAARKAAARVSGCALASDAYFPFADGVETAATLGITAVVQPGGSIRDSEVITAANAAGVAMVFTGVRHFRH
jgi:phosphoribosylaminoimidazolecarboxamide formyltransferase/IMP cyclohydrolase